MRWTRLLAHVTVVAALLAFAGASWHDRGSGAAPAPARSDRARPSERPTPATTRPAPPPRPVTILVVGDSTAKSTGHGLSQWAQRNPTLAKVVIEGAAGCGLVPGGTRVFVEGEQPVPPGCTEYLTTEVPAAVRRVHPDIVLVMSSWEVFDRRWEGGPVRTPTDGEYRLRMADALDRLLGSIRGAGAPRVSLALEPVTDPFWMQRYSLQEDPERHAPLHAVMTDAARADPDHVRTADVAGWLTSIGRVHDRGMRPDGVHWSWNGSQVLAADFLGPLLVRQARS